MWVLFRLKRARIGSLSAQWEREVSGEEDFGAFSGALILAGTKPGAEEGSASV